MSETHTGSDAPRIPSATYRLQFHAGFTFRDATDLLDYLDALGISDVYASPYFQASPDSTHGYDVADHNRLSPAIGAQSDYEAFCSALRARDMGQILDFVPNHMGISESLNHWWMEVLEDGRASPFADYFDIDWDPGKITLEDRVLLPILGERYGRVLENGQFSLEFDKGAFFLRYYETRLPLRPRSYPDLLHPVIAELDSERAAEVRDVLGSLSDPATKAAAKEKLAALATQHPSIATAIDQVLRRTEGTAGDPKSFDALHSLLEAQVYRLSYWRVAAEEINYRRFFDINTLAAICVEIPEVFTATHQLVFELLARGQVTGLRIDHIDGLWDPLTYLQRLQQRSAEHTGPPDTKGMYLLVEKIVELTNETLPSDWPVHGTTGYEFANQMVQCLTDSSAERKMTRTYERFTGLTTSFADLIYAKKKLTMEISLRSEVTALGRILDDLSEMHRDFRDYTTNMLTSAVREVMACFPVYRTYATEEGKLSAADEKNVLRAILAARRRNPSMEKAMFDFLRAVLLLRLPEGLTSEQREAHIRFVMKFQQCSGPVMAKGLEDTSFYIFNRLAALNEVGGSPGHFGISLRDFHTLNRERQKSWPHAMLSTSTHDTKRSEDVRMRMVAISELPRDWRQATRRWSKLNRSHRTTVTGAPAPSPNEEYLIYQTLLGTWPTPETNRQEWIQRIKDYMTKALKEAKVNSSWTEPNEEWETATMTFIDGILDESQSEDFLEDISDMAETISRLGALNSLTQLVVKCTAPGVPDIYQGTEIWDDSLVDPDNRRPIDFAHRRQLLASIESTPASELLAEWPTGRIKLHVLRTLLQFRRAHAAFFREAGYDALNATGTAKKHVIAYARRTTREELIVIVPRLTGSFDSTPLGDLWTDTEIPCPSGGTELLTGRTLPADAPTIRLSTLLTELPFAVLHRTLT